MRPAKINDLAAIGDETKRHPAGAAGRPVVAEENRVSEQENVARELKPTRHD